MGDRRRNSGVDVRVSAVKGSARSSSTSVFARRGLCDEVRRQLNLIGHPNQPVRGGKSAIRVAAIRPRPGV